MRIKTYSARIDFYFRALHFSLKIASSLKYFSFDISFDFVKLSWKIVGISIEMIHLVWLLALVTWMVHFGQADKVLTHDIREMV